MMMQEQLQEGLRRLTELADEFEVSERDFDRHSFPLRREGILLARVSQEVLEDWPADPGMGRIIEEGLRLARIESELVSPRVVSVTTKGCQYE